MLQRFSQFFLDPTTLEILLPILSSPAFHTPPTPYYARLPPVPSTYYTATHYFMAVGTSCFLRSEDKLEVISPVS